MALLVISLAATLASVLVRYQMAKTLPLGIGMVSFFAPTVAVIAESAYLPRRILAKFAFLLSLPPLLGFIIHRINYGSGVSSELLPNLDVLTTVLVASLFLRVAVEFLEHYFRIYKLEKLFSYYRVALGVVLATVLIFGN